MNDDVARVSSEAAAAAPAEATTTEAAATTKRRSATGSATTSAPPSSSEAELGAVYTPAHITITRVDGQMKRTVAVTEVMDQLLRYTQQNAQLLMVQEQLGVRGR